MDILAHTLGIDPFTLRRRNALRIGSITSTGQVVRDSAGLIECLDRVEAALREQAAAESAAPPPSPAIRRA